MFDGCLGDHRAAQDSDVVARAVAAVALAALAVIHVVDLPATLGPTPLVGSGYLGIIAVAVLAGAVIVVRSHWLAWAVAGGVAVAAMSGYLLTRSLSGGFFGDHGDVGNWNCPLGISALSVETLIILVASGWGLWQARSRTIRWSRRTRTPRVRPGTTGTLADEDRPLRPVQ